MELQVELQNLGEITHLIGDKEQTRYSLTYLNVSK